MALHVSDVSASVGCRSGFGGICIVFMFLRLHFLREACQVLDIQCAVANRVDKMSPGAMAPETDASCDASAPHASDLEGDMFSSRQCPSLHELGLSQHLVRAIRSQLW